MDETEDRRANLTQRLGALRPEQITDLMLALEGRIDALRLETVRVSQPIAIVGLAAQFAEASSAQAYGDLLFEGRDAIRSAPADRPERDGLPPGGYIDAVERFDAAFFGLRPDQADAMDPQHRLALMLAWQALEDAGAADTALRPRATGIFLGLGANDYDSRFHGTDTLSPAAILGNAGSIAAGRISHWLDLTGPALVIDTACSSSLVAVHAACRSLRAGECDLALTGGVNLVLDANVSTALAAAGMLGPGHACRTFDAAADGYVRGEGGGLVVLKRLADAQRDGDRIRAVIRGSAINHDGHSSALTAPNGAAQRAVIVAALADAGLSAQDVQAVECHGTGTPLGDPIEVQALAAAYVPDRTAPLLLGSCKTNIGHLEAAAGIAGLIKMVLALEAGRLPGTLHQSHPNPRIAWNELPVRIVDRTMDWPSAARRRAGVSSFGFSGTNAHVILEAAAPVPAAVAEAALPTILALSAHDAGSLRRQAAALADHLAAHPHTPVAGVAAALATGRGQFAHRAACLARSMEEALAGLRSIAEGEQPTAGATGLAGSERPKVAFLFSGQGSQWPGMAADLYAADPIFRDRVDAAACQLGIDLAALMFDPAAGGQLADTTQAQPALFVLEYALAERLASFGITPDIVAGHSLGEWSAACVAGMLPFEAALGVVAARGRLMGALPRDGEMAAVFAQIERVAPLMPRFGTSLDLAALNAPDEVVVSGDKAAIASLLADLDAAAIGCQRIATSHAFHSHLMDAAVAPFEQVVRDAGLSEARLPMVSNVTGTLAADFRDPAYWGHQIRQPVRFCDSLDSIAAHGADVVVEIGPAATLVGFAQRAPGFQGKAACFIPTMRRNRAAADTLALALCRLFAAGLDIRWPPSRAPRANLPGYPFAGERHWIASPDRRHAARDAMVTLPAFEPQPVATRAPGREEVRAGIAASLRRSLQLDEAALAGGAGFFALGVDSLALTEALSTLERRWKVAIPRRELFETLTTPRALLERVAREVDARAAEAAAPMPPAKLPSGSASTLALPPDESIATAVPQPASTSAEGTAFIADFAARYGAARGTSRHQREAFGAVLADSRAVAGFRPETKAMLYPIVGMKGEGSHIIDADGNDYVDLTMGFGVQLFGHNPPMVVDAMLRQLTEQGLFLGPQAEKAGEAATLIARLTGNERVVFCNSGTEAVMTALRLARHATGRPLVAMFAGSYHGHFDGTLARAADGASSPLASGTPLGMVADVVVLDYADPEGSQIALEALSEQLAAVIVEPVQSRRLSLQPRDFLKWLRGFTSRVGAALIFDEVLLGFRVGPGGAQAWAGVRADLVTYGKIVGGGLPIGVVSGGRAFLDGIDGGMWPLQGAGGPQAERTFFAGTFNKNPLAMAAATAVLSHLETSGPALQERLNAGTDGFCRHINAMLEQDGSPLRVEHFSSVLRFAGASDLFYNQLISRGVYVWEGRTCFLSTAHTDADLEHVAQAVLDSARALAAVGLMGSSARPAARATIATSLGQQALWMLSAFSPESAAAYNQTLVLSFAGPLDPATLGLALADLVARHDSLRMSFAETGAEAQIADRATVTLEVADMPDAEAGAAWVRAEAAKPFDLTRAPLLRAALLRIGASKCALAFIQPHIVTDGWSMQVLANELGRLYSARSAGTSANLPAPARYERFSAFARAVAADPEAAVHWKAVFASPPPALDLPADRPRPPLQTYGGGCARVLLPPALAAKLAAQAMALDCSLFSLCLAAYGRLLSELSGQDDVVVAIFAAGQPMVAEPGLTGYCISTVPVRLAGIGGADAVGVTRAAMARAMAFPAYPLSAIVKASGGRRDPSRPPLASASFNLDRVEALAPFGELAPKARANGHGSVRWDLNWNLELGPEGLAIDANFNTDLFDAARVEAWAARYRELLDGIGAEHAAASEAEAPLSIADYVARWALQTPDAPAVIDTDGTLSWSALARASGELAARLAAQGVGRGDRVAFCLERGAGPLVAMAAASHLGAAFVPLDAEHPAAHRAVMVADCGAKALVTDASTRGETASIPVLAWSRNAADVTAPPRTVCGASDLAYILFTSGSTGRSKGVMVSCGGLHAYAEAMLRRLSTPGPQVFAIVTSFAADLGYTSVIGAVVSGGSLNVVDAPTARDPAALIARLAHFPADVLKIVPSHLAALMTHPDAAALLPRRALICGGDVLTFALVERLTALRPGLRVFNHYGPTETTIGCTMVEVTPALAAAPGDGRVPVGFALDGAIVEIVDGAGTVLPAGETGEIRVSGAGVALGYLGPAADAGSGFIRRADGARAYLTGDLGSKDRDGLVRFLGRKDDMVKIRGHRVDPNGVAAVLRACPGVVDAAALVKRDGNGTARLFGAVVAPGQTAESLGAMLAGRLPDAQRPSSLVIVEALPLTANGKVDRNALMALFAAPRPRTATPPCTEGALATILLLWEELFSGLGEQPQAIAPDDDFFALGGDSIMAIQLAGKARAAGWLVSPVQIFTSPTPRALASVIQSLSVRGAANRGAVAEAVPLTPIQRWFMDIDMPGRRHWALTAVFDLPSGATAETVGAALSAVVRRHDALRVRLRDGVPPLQQVDTTAALPTVLQQPLAPGEDLASAEDRIADRLVAKLDPATGRQFAVGMIETAAARRLIVAVHHLAFDMVSWAILAHDLAAALSDPPQPVPAPATAWSWWCRHQAASVAAFEVDRAFWQAVAELPVTVPLDHPGAEDLEGAAQCLELRLSADLSQRMLADLTERFGLQPHESVLAIVARAMFAWTGRTLQVELEGHGREPGDTDIDLSRTIGWFTTRYPVALPADAADLPHWLLAVKDSARAAAARSMSYGRLRSAAVSLTGPRPQLSFNYLGEIGRFGHGGLPLVRLGAGRERAARAVRPHRLAFNCWQDGGALVIRCEYGAGHEAATIERLLDAIAAEADACRSVAVCSERRYSPSDFAALDLSQADLDALSLFN